MARTRYQDDTTVTPVLRDGFVYFRYEGRPLSERLCRWALGFLWLLAAGAAVAALV
jgi:hypothetical protein